MLKIKLTALVFLAFGGCVASWAQETLSLENAVARALQNNFDIRIAEASVEIAANNNSWGQTSALPSIALSAGFNATINDQSQNPTAFIQEKLEVQALNYSANLNWVLFDGLGMFIQKRQLELLESQSEGNASLIIENTVQALTLAYYDVLMQRERLNVLTEVIALSRDLLNYVNDKRELGAGSTFEVLQFENNVVTDSSNYLIQELAYRNATRNLNLLMGIDPETEFALTTPLQAPTVAYSYATIWDEVKNNNTALRNQFVNSLLAQQDYKLAQSAMFPVVSFSAGITENANQFRVRSLDLAAEGATLNYFGNFALNFNLFNGGRTRRAMQNARIREEVAQLQQNELELQVQSDLRNALDLYTAQLAIYQLTDGNVGRQRLALDIAADRFANGLITSFDYRQQQVAFLNAEMARIQALQNLLNTHTQLVRLRGGLVSGR
ncbi:MAG: TolC family protein [Flavobacteriales bacterium]